MMVYLEIRNSTIKYFRLNNSEAIRGTLIRHAKGPVLYLYHAKNLKTKKKQLLC
ncbi:MAG: hypothetical protein WD032_11390 [Nitrospirales bacterium]